MNTLTLLSVTLRLKIYMKNITTIIFDLSVGIALVLTSKPALTSAVVFISFFSSYSIIHGQEAGRRNLVHRYVNGLLKDDSELSKPQMIIYPVVGYAPETDIELGISGLFLYYANRDTTNRLSDIYVRSFYTLESQYGFIIEHALYTDKDEWFFLGNARAQNFPLYFYGVGNSTPLSNRQLVESFQIGAKQRILREIIPNLYGGLEFEFNKISRVDFSRSDIIENSPEIIGKNGYMNLGLGLGIVWDTRRNVLNVRNGSFSELAFLYNHRSLGSDFNFGIINSDTRFFKQTRKNQVLAFQLFGQYSWGDVPFGQLPQFGGIMIGRGYYQGRFRDIGQWASQVEYRFLPLPLGFTNRLGAAVFASTGQVFNNKSGLQFNNLKHAIGGGLRFLLFPKKDVYVRADYAFTPEGGGFYFFIGEAF